MDNRSEEFVEKLKFWHIHYLDWLKCSKPTSNKLFTFIMEQIIQKNDELGSPFLLIDANINGYLHIMNASHFFNIWLLRKNKLYFLNQLDLIKRLTFKHQTIMSIEKDQLTITACKIKTIHQDTLFLQFNRQAKPTNRKSYRQWKECIGRGNPEEFDKYGIFGKISVSLLKEII